MIPIQLSLRVAWSISFRVTPTKPSPHNPLGKSVLREIAGVFVRLGFTTFGGPLAHVGMMQQETVVRRKWIDQQQFVDLYASLNFLPGPSSTQLCMGLGYHRAGLRGLVVAGFCFITPAMLIILPLGFLYVQYGTLPQARPLLSAIAAAVVAIIGAATVRFARTSLKNSFTLAICVIVLILGIALRNFPQRDILLLAVAAFVGFMHTRLRTFRATLVSAAPLPMVIFFLKVGATLYGSGYFLVTLLQSGLVDSRHWLTQQQLADSIAVGQFTPGPLLTTATFVGYILGQDKFLPGTAGAILGAVLATAAIFAPSFFLVAIFAPVIRKLPKYPGARGALDAANAAIVALLALTTIRLFAGGSHAVLGIAITLISFACLLIWEINATWLVLASALFGILAQFLRLSL
jgi:chromate transporter